MEGSECAALPLMNRHLHVTHARAVYRGVAPTPRSGCSCVVIENNCIIFGGTLTVEKDVEQQDAAGLHSASLLSRVYFNDLVYATAPFLHLVFVTFVQVLAIRFRCSSGCNVRLDSSAEAIRRIVALCALWARSGGRWRGALCIPCTACL